MNKNIPYKIKTIAIIVVVGIFLFYYLTLKNTTPRNNFVERIREKHRAGFDSLQKAINYENDLNYRIKKSIHAGDFTSAYSLMDSLPPFGKTNTIHLYKGMIYEEQKNYTAAIEVYNIVIYEEPFPLALGKRAGVYIKTNKPDSALNDFKKAYALNYDYSLQVAETYELLHKKDSAITYYQIYLGHYPTDTAVQQKIKSLKSIKLF